ncbi:hypothetical protein ABT282_07685 [Streptomyces sp. NPDC000927]|uniref:hypothetical protein n=1 Tax=Streptomyces sp. NPDC000927 TaxID=3154371 RepID=UPI0033336469
MGHDHDDEHDNHGEGHDLGKGRRKKRNRHKIPHVGSIQVYRDGDTTVLLVDGEEARIPGIHAEAELEANGQVTVTLHAKLSADRFEVGGLLGS